MSSEGQLDIPKPTIKRIVKEKLSAVAGGNEGATGDVQLNKEALLAFGESAKVFISYITAAANDICKDKKRATLNADDIFAALEELEFQDMLPELKAAFEAYKQSTKEKKDKKAEISRKRKSAGQAPEGEAPAEAAEADTKAAAGHSQQAADYSQEAAAAEDTNADAAAAVADQDGDKNAEQAEDEEMQEAEDEVKVADEEQQH